MSGPLTIAVAMLAGLAGLGAGWLHFRTLRIVAAGIVAGRRRVLPFQLLRLAGLALFLVLCAMAGAPALLAATAGILIGRRIVLRRAEGEAP